MQVRHFKTPWWLKNPHLQTSWGAFFRPEVTVDARRVHIPLRDNTLLYAESVLPAGYEDTDERLKTVCVILHGLTGSASSHYVRGFQKAIQASGLPVLSLAVNHRGSLGLDCPAFAAPTLYHAGIVDELQDILAFVMDKYPSASIRFIGVSLSGNMLVRALGLGLLPAVSKAMAISVPFELHAAADQVDKGMGRLYRRYLVQRMRAIITIKQQHLPDLPQRVQLAKLGTFWGVDNFVVAPMHGFRNVHHYYKEASCREVMSEIHQPLLIIQSLDDPLVPLSAWPATRNLPDCVDFEAYDRGGHVGFISPDGYWLEWRIVQWLSE